MSLEAALAEHTTALKENTAAIIASNEGRAKAIAAAGELKNGTTGRPPGSKNKTAEDKKAPAVETDKPKTLTKEQDEKLRKTVGDWLGAVDDGPERNARKAVIIKINGEYGIKKVTEIDPGDYDVFMEKIAEGIAAHSEGDDADLV